LCCLWIYFHFRFWGRQLHLCARAELCSRHILIKRHLQPDVRAVRCGHIYSFYRLYELHELPSRYFRGHRQLFPGKVLQLLSWVLLCISGLGSLLCMLIWFGLRVWINKLHNSCRWPELYARHIFGHGQFRPHLHAVLCRDLR